MYPRNAASPPRIAVGAVIQISDGEVQSSGVSVVVRPEGGSETAGGGTVSYGASSSVVYYAPAQAETNYTAFVVTAYKTGCIPVSVTVITSASSTAGKVDLIDAPNATAIAAIQSGLMLATEDGSSFTALPAMIEAAILDEGDATALLAAIAAKVEEFLINDGDATATMAAIATAVWSAATRTLSTGGVSAIQSGLSTLDAAGIRAALGMSTANLDAQLAAIQVIVTDWTDGGRLDLILDTIAGDVVNLDGAAMRGTDGANTTPPPTAETIASQVDTTLSGTHGAGLWSSSGAGDGARTITVTVDDGTDPIEGARVRYTNGVQRPIGTTDENGQTTLNVDDLTWTVSITKDGYSFGGGSHVVTADEAVTYSMTAIAIAPPPNASTSTGVMRCLDERAVVEPGVDVTVRIYAGPGTDGYAYDRSEWTETSDGDGIVQFAGLVRGATYEIWRTDKQSKTRFVVPDAESFDISEVIGSP